MLSSMKFWICGRKRYYSTSWPGIVNKSFERRIILRLDMNLWICGKASILNFLLPWHTVDMYRFQNISIPKTVFFISDLSWQNIQIKLIPTGSNTLHRQLCWNLLVYGDSESAILPLLDCAPWRNGRHVQVHVLQNQRKIRGLCCVADSFWPWRWYGDIQGSSAGTKLVTKNSYHVRVFRMNSSSVWLDECTYDEKNPQNVRTAEFWNCKRHHKAYLLIMLCWWKFSSWNKNISKPFIICLVSLIGLYKQTKNLNT